MVGQGSIPLWCAAYMQRIRPLLSDVHNLVFDMDLFALVFLNSNPHRRLLDLRFEAIAIYQ